MSTRLNKFVAQASGISRRQADAAIERGEVTINGEVAIIGNQVQDGDSVALNGTDLTKTEFKYILVNKPVGYVCSRASQDDKPTVYSLLPESLSDLKIAGRLDADSRGLVMLTNDGDYAQELTHPKHQKEKVYTAVLNRELRQTDIIKINAGLEIEDGKSDMQVSQEKDYVLVKMREGRNRQIRRTFGALGYAVDDLNRIKFGPYTLDDLQNLVYNKVNKRDL